MSTDRAGPSRSDRFATLSGRVAFVVVSAPGVAAWLLVVALLVESRSDLHLGAPLVGASVLGLVPVPAVLLAAWRLRAWRSANMMATVAIALFVLAFVTLGCARVVSLVI